MQQRILVTGSSGLIGTAVVADLLSHGHSVNRFDLRERGDAAGDIRDCKVVREAVQRVDGVIHLAAVSRVITAEHHRDLCWSTNVDGLMTLLDAVKQMARPPWVIFASSREVYGQAESLPVTENCPLRPVNIYGRSKVAGEEAIAKAAQSGLRACTVRFSNVYGSALDHPDRVIPAFVRAALLGEPLRVDGANNTFDFTNLADVVRGVALLAQHLAAGGTTPAPIHFVTGEPTTLAQLARTAVRITGSTSEIRLAPSRTFDVAHFVGDPSGARRVLGWKPSVNLDQGIAMLAEEFRKLPAASDFMEQVG